MNPFPPISDYAFLSDCETAALVSPAGDVEWMCVPRMDSESVFAAILDRDAGHFRLGPAEGSVPAGRRYQSAYAALSWAGRRAPASNEEATERVERTIAYWRDWLARGRGSPTTPGAATFSAARSSSRASPTPHGSRGRRPDELAA